MGFQRWWNCGNWVMKGIGWKLKVCLKWCVENLCQFATTITSMCIAFGIKGWSVFAAIHGQRFCTTRLQGRPGIGFPNALHCLISGAVDSGGFLLFQNCMLQFDGALIFCISGFWYLIFPFLFHITFGCACVISQKLRYLVWWIWRILFLDCSC